MDVFCSLPGFSRPGAVTSSSNELLLYHIISSGRTSPAGNGGGPGSRQRRHTGLVSSA